MISKQSPIAVFDSGMGGISVLKELHKIMPNENFLYLGDSKNAPYGVKTTEEICELTTHHVENFIKQGAKAVVIACNTATSAAADSLRSRYRDFPIIGLEPALKPAALCAHCPRVLVMATPLTIREKKFRRLQHEYDDRAEFFNLPAPNLVTLVEDLQLSGEKLTAYLEEILKPYKNLDIDCVVLGCTHFPFVRGEIERFFDNKVLIFDGGEGSARQTKRVLEAKNLLNDSQEKGTIVFENSLPEKIDYCKRLFEHKG